MAAVACLAQACAADPGDALKTSDAQASGSESGAASGSGDATVASGSGSGTGSGSGAGGSPEASSMADSAGSDADGAVPSDAARDVSTVMEAGRILPEGGASCITAGAACPLKVQWETPGSQADAIKVYLNIVNVGSAAVDLANVKVHYYFNAQGDTSLVFECDYAGYYQSAMTGINLYGVMGTFYPMGVDTTPYTDTYLEISFISASVPVGATVNVQFQIHDANYAVNYVPSSDWSHLSTPSSMGYVDAETITAYLNGTLAWGIEPGPLPDGSAPPDASAGDADGSLGDAPPDASSGPADAAEGG